MSRSSKLSRIMKEELPSLSFQRRMSYRTDCKEVLSLFRVINREIFNNKLPLPEIEVVSNCRDYWGFCTGQYFGLDEATNPKSNCKLRLSDKWYCKQWLVAVLAHEMCHQYQWDVTGKARVKRGKSLILSHGPSFFKHKAKLLRFGIHLKESFCHRKWFSYQDFRKC